MMIVTTFPGQPVCLLKASQHTEDHINSGRWKLPFIREATPAEVELGKPCVDTKAAESPEQVYGEDWGLYG